MSSYIQESEILFVFFLPGLSLEVNVIVRYDPNYFGILILITDLLKSQLIFSKMHKNYVPFIKLLLYRFQGNCSSSSVLKLISKRVHLCWTTQ